MKCPCRGCPDRTITCHGVCEKYQDWKKHHEDERRWIREQTPIPSERMLKKKDRDIKRKARGWTRSGPTNGE